jgi:hypothetical protein
MALGKLIITSIASVVFLSMLSTAIDSVNPLPALPGNVLYLSLYLMPIAFVGLGLGYYWERNPGKKMRTARFGYVCGFIAGSVFMSAGTFYGVIFALGALFIGWAVSSISIKKYLQDNSCNKTLQKNRRIGVSSKS